MNPDNQWDDLTTLLDDELIRTRGQGLRVWKAAWTTERSMEVLLKNFQEVENHFITQIEEAIDTWCATGMGDWVDMDASAMALVRMRLEVAATFTNLMKIGPMSRTTTVIPYPELPNGQVVRWLLIDWWNEHG